MIFRLFTIFLFPIVLYAEAVGPNTLVELAIASNPSLGAAQARTDAAEARIPQVQSLPDPELDYKYHIQRMSDRQEIMLRQRFPYPGTLRLRGDAAGAAADASVYSTEALRRNVTADIHELYADLAYLEATLTILSRNSELYAQTESLIEGRIEAGQASSAELLRTHIARARVDDERASLESQRPALAAQLNAIIGRPADHPLPTLKPLADYLRKNEDRANVSSFGDNPELLSLDRTLASQRSAIELARRSGRPDFAIGVEWMDTVSGQRDEVKLMFGVTLPIWRQRYRAAEREARAEMRAIENSRLERQFALEAELRDATERHTNAMRRAKLYRDNLIPQARAVVTAEESAYRAGKTDILNLIEAQRVLLDLERIEQQALAEKVRAEAIIRRITG